MSLCEHMQAFALYYRESPVQVLSVYALELHCGECERGASFDEWMAFLNIPAPLNREVEVQRG